jgi:tetratricopeptide (TPR) repeat protein
MAEMAREDGDEARAREALARALELDLSAAQRQRAHDRLGLLYVDRDVDRAIAHMSKAAHGPDLDVASESARLVAALEALNGGGDPVLARAQLGEALYRHGELQAAQRQLEQALEAAPEYVDAHAYLGHVLSLLGEDNLAVHHLEQATALEPAYPLPSYFLGMHYVRKGWTVTGREVLLRAHDLDPMNPAICAAVADTYLRADRAGYAAAERWLHAAVDRAPDDVRFHLLLAHFYVDYNVDPSVRGVAVAQVAVGLDPGSSEALETLGWAYHLGGKPSAALDPLLRAVELDPQRARIHYRLGEVYRTLGRTQNAIDAYQRAVDLDWGGTVGERAHRRIQGQGPLAAGDGE